MKVKYGFKCNHGADNYMRVVNACMHAHMQSALCDPDSSCVSVLIAVLEVSVCLA